IPPHCPGAPGGARPPSPAADSSLPWPEVRPEPVAGQPAGRVPCGRAAMSSAPAVNWLAPASKTAPGSFLQTLHVSAAQQERRLVRGTPDGNQVVRQSSGQGPAAVGGVLHRPG